MTAPRPVPIVTDPDTGGFFESAARDMLALCTCVGCDAVLHLPGPRCSRCGSFETRWRPVSGKGRLYSWTTVEHQVHPAFPPPYTIVLVELDDAPGTRLLGHLPGRPKLAPGMAMRVWFEPVADEVKLPQWQPVPDIEEHR